MSVVDNGQVKFVQLHFLPLYSFCPIVLPFLFFSYLSLNTFCGHLKIRVGDFDSITFRAENEIVNGSALSVASPQNRA